jgi:hypothetical protein
LCQISLNHLIQLLRLLRHLRRPLKLRYRRLLRLLHYRHYGDDDYYDDDRNNRSLYMQAQARTADDNVAVVTSNRDIVAITVPEII